MLKLVWAKELGAAFPIDWLAVALGAVPNAAFPVPKAEFPEPKAEFPVPKAEFPEPNAEPPVPKAEFPVPNAEFPVPRVLFPDPKALLLEPNPVVPPTPNPALFCIFTSTLSRIFSVVLKAVDTGI